MQVRSVDPRYMKWEVDHAQYRVYFWDTSAITSHEYEVTGADIEEVLAWAQSTAQSREWLYTVYVKVDDDGQPGLVRLSGVLGDLFASAMDPARPPGRGRFRNHAYQRRG